MSQPLTLLLLDHSTAIFQTLEPELSQHDIHVIHTTELKAMSRTLERTSIDLMVLDYGSLINNDISFVKTLRDNGNMSLILMLSHTGTSQECVECLSAGADDYLIKPFAHVELTARIRSLARYASERKQNHTKHDIQGLHLDADALKATFDHCDLSLTRTEYRILAAIERHGGDTITHEALLEELHGYEIDLTRNSIEVHISAIRRKLQGAGAPATIHTRRGFGYYIEKMRESHQQ